MLKHTAELARIARHSCWARIETEVKIAVQALNIGSPGIHAGRGLKLFYLNVADNPAADRPAFMLGAD